MKKKIILISALIYFTNLVSIAQKPIVDKKGFLTSMNNVDISSMIQPVPDANVFSDPDYNIWCGSVVKGTNNKFYMFYSRWPRSEGHYAWLPSSEIALAVADNPQGPYKHVKVIFEKRGSKYWDGVCTHNPAAIVYKGKYYLYYMGTTGTKVVKMPASAKDDNWWEYRNNQRIGVAVADNPEGYWKRFDKPVLDANPDSTAFDAMMVSNPAITVDKRGRAVLVYKAVCKNGTLRGGNVRFGIAYAPSLLGPYKKSEKTIFEVNDGGKNKMVAEDPYIWYYKDTLYAITRDVVCLFAGPESALALLKSKDGINWEKTKFPMVAKKKLAFENGTITNDQIERPCLYLEKGVPKFLFGAQVFKKRKYSVNIAIPLNWVDSSKIVIPKIIGEWKHVYQPQGDIFSGPDSQRFKTGMNYPNWQVNDHFILKGNDNRWHALGITHPAIEPGPNEKNPHEAEWFLFHAVAAKGKLNDNLSKGSWLDKTKVLPPSERPNELREIHSPHILAYKKGYFMVYGHSPMRYALSKDLYKWQPKGELFREAEGARDPFILKHGEVYYMSYTSGQKILMRTSVNLLKWSSPVTIFELQKEEKGGAESPQILLMNGGFYLIFCRWDASLTNFSYQNKSYVYYSTDIFNFKNRKPIAEIEGHAPEFFRDENGDWWISSAERPYRGVSIAPIKWMPLK